MNLREWRLAQAREALAWNTARATFPEHERAACYCAEIALGAIVRRQSFLANVRAAWRAAEDRLERGDGGL